MAQIKGGEVTKNGLLKISTRSNMQFPFNKAETPSPPPPPSWSHEGKTHIRDYSMLRDHQLYFHIPVKSRWLLTSRWLYYQDAGSLQKKKPNKPKSHIVQVSIPLHWNDKF